MRSRANPAACAWARHGLIIALLTPSAAPRAQGSLSHHWSPRNPEKEAAIECEYGTSLARYGFFEKAESVFVRMVARNPDAPCALNNLGNLRLLQGDVRGAVALYEHAIKIDHNDIGSRLNHAVALVLLGKQRRGVEQALKAIGKRSELFVAASMLGLWNDMHPEYRDAAADTTPLRSDEVAALLEFAVLTIPSVEVPKPPGDAPRRMASPGGERSHWRAAVVRQSADPDLVLYDGQPALHWRHSWR